MMKILKKDEQEIKAIVKDYGYEVDADFIEFVETIYSIGYHRGYSERIEEE